MAVRSGTLSAGSGREELIQHAINQHVPRGVSPGQKITEAEKRKLKFPRRKKKRKSTSTVADKSSRTRKPPRWFPARREPASPDWFRPAPKIAFRPLRRKWKKPSGKEKEPWIVEVEETGEIVFSSTAPAGIVAAEPPSPDSPPASNCNWIAARWRIDAEANDVVLAPEEGSAEE